MGGLKLWMQVCGCHCGSSLEFSATDSLVCMLDKLHMFSFFHISSIFTSFLLKYFFFSGMFSLFILNSITNSFYNDLEGLEECKRYIFSVSICAQKDNSAYKSPIFSDQS